MRPSDATSDRLTRGGCAACDALHTNRKSGSNENRMRHALAEDADIHQRLFSALGSRPAQQRADCTRHRMQYAACDEQDWCKGQDAHPTSLSRSDESAQRIAELAVCVIDSTTCPGQRCLSAKQVDDNADRFATQHKRIHKIWSLAPAVRERERW